MRLLYTPPAFTSTHVWCKIPPQIAPRRFQMPQSCTLRFKVQENGFFKLTNIESQKGTELPIRLEMPLGEAVAVMLWSGWAITSAFNQREQGIIDDRIVTERQISFMRPAP